MTLYDPATLGRLLSKFLHTLLNPPVRMDALIVVGRAAGRDSSFPMPERTGDRRDDDDDEPNDDAAAGLGVDAGGDSGASVE